MADHLNVPGAFAYIRLVPDPKPSDDTDSSDKGPTALPVESSVDETAVASEPDADVKDSNEALAPTSAVAKKKTNIAIDAWKQKTHDRRQHHHDFDRFLNEGVAPDPGTLSDSGAGWELIKVQHEFLDVALNVLAAAKASVASSEGVDALLSLGKGPEVPDGAVLFQDAVGFWLDDHNLRDYVHVEWVSGMTTLGQVVESEGACACSTTYEVEVETDVAYNGNSSNSQLPAPQPVAASTTAGAASTGAVIQSSNLQSQAQPQAPPAVAPLTAAAKPGPTGRRLTLMLSRTMKRLRQNLIAGLLDHEICTHALRFSNEWSQPWAGRRLQCGLPPSSCRAVASAEEGLATINGLLNKTPHQRRLVHAALMYVAASAGEGRTFQELFDYLGEFVSSPAVRFGLCRKAKSGSGPSPIAAVGRKQIYFEGAIQVLRAVLDADEKIVAWQEQQQEQQQEEVATTGVVNSNSKTSSSVVPIPAAAVATETPSSSSSTCSAPSSTLAPEPWDPVPLHCGRLPVDKPEKYHRMVNIAVATLPHFLRNGPEAHEAYRVALRQIAKLNGVTSSSVAKAARVESERLKAQATAAAVAEAATKAAGDGSNGTGAAAVETVGLAGLAKLLGCDVTKTSTTKPNTPPLDDAAFDAAAADTEAAAAVEVGTGGSDGVAIETTGKSSLATEKEVALPSLLPQPVPLPESSSSDLPTIAPSFAPNKITAPPLHHSKVDPRNGTPKLPTIAVANGNSQSQRNTSLRRPASCHSFTSLSSSSTPSAAAATTTAPSTSKDSDSANIRPSRSREVGSVARLKAVRSFRDLKSENLAAAAMTSPLPRDRSRASTNNNSNNLPRSGSTNNLRGRGSSSCNGIASAPSTPPRKGPETTAAPTSSSSTPATPTTASQRRARRDSSSLNSGLGNSSNMPRPGAVGQLPRSGKRSAPARDAGNTPVKKKLNAAAEMLAWAALASLGDKSSSSSSSSSSSGDSGSSSSATTTNNNSSSSNSSISKMSANSSSTKNNAEHGELSGLPPLLPAGPEFSEKAEPDAGKCPNVTSEVAAAPQSLKSKIDNMDASSSNSSNDAKNSSDGNNNSSSAASRWAALRESWRLADEKTNALMERASIDQSDPSTTPQALNQSSSGSSAGLTLAAIRKSNAKALRAKGKGTAAAAYDSDSESGEEEEDDNTGGASNSSSGAQSSLLFSTPLWAQWVRACQRSRAMLSSTILVQAWARALQPQRTLRIAKKAAVTLAARFRGSLSRLGKGFCRPEPEELSEADKGFLKAVGLGQRAVAEEWLAKGAKPKSRNLHGHPAVTLAARSGELTILTWLHQHLGLSVRARSDDGRSVAAVAAWHGHLHVVKYVYEADRQASEAAAAAATAAETAAASNLGVAADEAAASVASDELEEEEEEEEEEKGEGLVVKRNAAEITKTPVRATRGAAAAMQPPLSPPSPPSVVNPGLDCEDGNSMPSVPAVPSLTTNTRNKPMGKRARWRLRHRLSQTHDEQEGKEPALLPPSPEKQASSQALTTMSTIAPASPMRSPSANDKSTCRKLVLAPCSPDQEKEKEMISSSRSFDERVPEIGTEERNPANDVTEGSSLGDVTIDDDGKAYDAADSSRCSDLTAAGAAHTTAAAAAAKSQAALARAMRELEAARALDWDAVAAVAKSRGETRILKWLQMASKAKGR